MMKKRNPILCGLFHWDRGLQWSVVKGLSCFDIPSKSCLFEVGLSVGEDDVGVEVFGLDRQFVGFVKLPCDLPPFAVCGADL